MIINFPAPEEARTYKDYVQLFRARNPSVNFANSCKLLGRDQKRFFDDAWNQPEAEQIHAAYKGMAE